MAANGSPPPVFEFDEDHSYFMVRLPVHAEAAGKDMGVPRKLGVESQLESQLELGVELGVESGMGMQVLQLLHQKTLGKLEIARLLGKDRPSRYLNDLMKKLLESGTVEYTIPDKPNSRNQRYRLTPAGRDLLGKLKSGDD
jgi:ATP-dependent DNA helicase RecG